MNWKNEALGLKVAGSGYLYVTDGGIPHSIPYIRGFRLTIIYTTRLGTDNRKVSFQVVADQSPRCGCSPGTTRADRATVLHPWTSQRLE